MSSACFSKAGVGAACCTLQVPGVGHPTGTSTYLPQGLRKRTSPLVSTWASEWHPTRLSFSASTNSSMLSHTVSLCHLDITDNEAVHMCEHTAFSLWMFSLGEISRVSLKRQRWASLAYTPSWKGSFYDRVRRPRVYPRSEQSQAEPWTFRAFDLPGIASVSLSWCLWRPFSPPSLVMYSLLPLLSFAFP